jgi:ketosteroid isomerase-like protein
MSEQNVKRLRELYRERTFEAFAESLHPAAEMHQAHEVPDADDYYGREEFVRGTRRWLEEWDEFKYFVEDAVDLGERAFLRVHLSGRAKASGIELDQSVFHIWTFRDGMPWRCEVFLSEERALEAAGLPK